MRYRENHSECKDWTIRIIIGGPLIYMALVAFVNFALAAHCPDESESDITIHILYLFVTLSYMFTYHLFIFAMSNIKSRFWLLNINLMFV
jgi:hypothetical protein